MTQGFDRSPVPESCLFLCFDLHQLPGVVPDADGGAVTAAGERAVLLGQDTPVGASTVREGCVGDGRRCLFQEGAGVLVALLDVSDEQWQERLAQAGSVGGPLVDPAAALGQSA
ncbi:hypothetical protein [Streptomyces murinus]|uniref:hypothetical protein n=1 Tax=Streptomyces murinus TaxID=33900 RepID=UPI0037F61020